MIRGAIITVAVLVGGCGFLILTEAVFTGMLHWPNLVPTIVFGWALFLARVLPEVTVDLTHLAMAAVTILVFLAGAHAFCGWIYRHAQQAPEGAGESRPWRFSWTAALAAMIALLFVAGMSVVGVVEQTRWLAETEEPFSAERYEGNPLEVPYRLKQVGLAAHPDQWRRGPNRDTFDPGVSRDKDGLELHSWQTLILPGFNIYLEGLDLKKPWDDPQHAEHFSHPVPMYLNPAIRMPAGERPRYAPSHISANQYVLGPHAPLQVGQIRDGLSETFLAGQVAANFHPWAKPGNWRDPGLGINASPHGFGAPGDGALMILCDGSVRFFANGTDRAVLKALATPSGYEKVRLDEVSHAEGRRWR